ncbi:hypothetical protein SEA_SKOG_127 [Gordonia phage Skog]|uniref:Uncharacterized protein n=1 Tax=Gordonia phage Skog TaxID=2704033 RepID=A0A6G6XJI8_9CAUD|nr:hypothetical protein KHQ85_gp127 [Gordonia phage Skog]QIG58279.1 hypothetical protein SEA_SKOG_127 [Gordonia phage Skog]
MAITVESMIDSIKHMDKAIAQLEELRQTHAPGSSEYTRLGHKIEGVKLARSYFRGVE